MPLAPARQPDSAFVPQPDGATAALVLADGSVFWGRGIGASGAAVGEICFNTSITGYQEILTDPSYAGQIVTFHLSRISAMSAPILEDIESVDALRARPDCQRRPDPACQLARDTRSFDDWLKSWNLIGLARHGYATASPAASAIWAHPTA